VGTDILKPSVSNLKPDNATNNLSLIENKRRTNILSARLTRHSILLDALVLLTSYVDTLQVVAGIFELPHFSFDAVNHLSI